MSRHTSDDRAGLDITSDDRAGPDISSDDWAGPDITSANRTGPDITSDCILTLIGIVTTYDTHIERKLKFKKMALNKRDDFPVYKNSFAHYKIK